LSCRYNESRKSVWFSRDSLDTLRHQATIPSQTEAQSDNDAESKQGLRQQSGSQVSGWAANGLCIISQTIEQDNSTKSNSILPAPHESWVKNDYHRRIPSPLTPTSLVLRSGKH
jgi:hypothetical protein